MSVTKEHLHAILYTNFLSPHNERSHESALKYADEATEFYMHEMERRDIDEQQVQKVAEEITENTNGEHITHVMRSRHNFIKLLTDSIDGVGDQRLWAEELVLAERVEQINMHGRSLSSDVATMKMNPRFFTEAAKFCITQNWAFLPSGFDDDVASKIKAKSLPERLIIAASFLLANADAIISKLEAQGDIPDVLLKYYDQDNGNMYFDEAKWNDSQSKIVDAGTSK